jgi:membrane-bound serine protease (ClpP class)
MLKRTISLILLLASTVLFIHLSLAQSLPSYAAVVEIKGAIGPASQDFVARGLQQAQQRGARAFILQIDTPGGLSKSMRGMIKAILASSIPVISYVAPSGARAASAGTYLLYASHIAAMAPGTNLGAATPVSIGTPQLGSQNKKKVQAKSASEKKAINDAKAYIRGLAQLRGRNVEWAEKAVSQAASLSAQEALKINVINLIAKDRSTLLQKIDGLTVLVRGHEQILKTKGLGIKVIQPDWRSRFLLIITDPSVAYILLMIGFYGLFFEFSNPGYIVPGVLGGIALILALYAFQLLPVNYAGLGLIILGLAFIVAEAFLPSFGILGIGGIIGFVMGSILLIKTDMVGFGIPWGLIAAVALISLTFFIGVLQLAFRARRRKVVSGAEGMIDQRGVIVLRDGQPWVKVVGELWQISQPQGLSEGDVVTVMAIEGLFLKVEKQE